MDAAKLGHKWKVPGRVLRVERRIAWRKYVVIGDAASMAPIGLFRRKRRICEPLPHKCRGHYLAKESLRREAHVVYVPSWGGVPSHFFYIG